MANQLSDIKFNVQSSSRELPSRKDLTLDPRTVFLAIGQTTVFLWVGSSLQHSCSHQYLECARRAHANLVRFEGAPKSLEIVRQFEEPLQFWRALDMRGLDSPQRGNGGALNRPDPAELYRVNKNWNNWFVALDDELRIRSARSQKSILAYAERTELENKPALFVYPFYQEPLFLLDLDDLAENVFAILCDKQTKQCFVWKGSLFEENDDESGELNLQEFVHLAVESFFENDNLNDVEYVFENSGEESDEFFAYFS